MCRKVRSRRPVGVGSRTVRWLFRGVVLGRMLVTCLVLLIPTWMVLVYFLVRSVRLVYKTATLRSVLGRRR